MAVMVVLVVGGGQDKQLSKLLLLEVLAVEV
jgi:hypothetical protein